MEILFSIGHIIGSLIAFGIMIIILANLGDRVQAKANKQTREEILIATGIKIEDLYKKKNARETLKVFSEKFSSDLLKNRISDFCGSILKFWDFLGVIAYVATLIIVLWYTVAHGTENAIYAWLIVPMGIFFWSAYTLFFIICKLLTGRYPGFAKYYRELAADMVQNNNGLFNE
jgi:hypothetical protein